MPVSEPKYEVALSFAGEQRTYVEAVAAGLKSADVTVFYDDYERAYLWGKNLYDHLDWVYRKASKYCVMFVSDEYATKVWTSHERRSAQARALSENIEYVLPVRFDDTEVPGLLETIGYIDGLTTPPKEVVGLIIAKLGPQSIGPNFPTTPDLLWKELGSSRSAVKERERVRAIGYSFYRALSRMTSDERTAVAGLLAFGCPGELPQGVHISLDLLSRMTKLPKAALVEALRSVRSLNFKVHLRDRVHDPDPAELMADDQDVFMEFRSSSSPQSEDSTRIAYAVVRCASEHFCEDHGLEVVTQLDFGNLSSSTRSRRSKAGVSSHRTENAAEPLLSSEM